jgi:hypothetical protein
VQAQLRRTRADALREATGLMAARKVEHDVRPWRQVARPSDPSSSSGWARARHASPQAVRTSATSEVRCAGGRGCVAGPVLSFYEPRTKLKSFYINIKILLVLLITSIYTHMYEILRIII